MIVPKTHFGSTIAEKRTPTLRCGPVFFHYFLKGFLLLLDYFMPEDTTGTLYR